MLRGTSKAFVAAVAVLTGVSLALATLASPARGDPPATKLSPRLVTSWPWVDPYGCFAEGMALGADGSLYASVTTWGDEVDLGQIVKIAPGTGQQAQFGPTIETPGLLTGVAFDSQGRLYVADATFSEEDPPGVLRVEAGQVTRVLTLPAESFPNGLAIRNGSLYVSDSALGAVWKAPLNGHSTPQTPWLEDDRLLPDHAIGANGIAFGPSGDLYVAVSDAGLIARVPVLGNGTAGALRIVLERPQLRTVDGIAFDRRGDLWMTTNGPASGRLLRLTTAGQLMTLADNPTWLDYPTQPVLASGRWEGTVFVENGSYETSWTPTVVALPGMIP